MTLDYTDKDPIFQKAQYRWKARNHINGLVYGNGGISSWTKEYVMNMKTHEASDGNDTHTVDFCLDYTNSIYWSMNDCYSTTYPNSTPFQAWRAGFREGVKMCLLGGRKPTIEEFKQIPSRNLDNLTIWHNVGNDIENGEWAIYGARLGTYMTMLTDWDHKLVQDFDTFNKLWEENKDKIPSFEAERLAESLRDKLGLPICTFDNEQSRFFKRHYKKHQNLGTLVREIDVIRKLEGW